MDKEELVIKLAEEFGISSIDIYNFVNCVAESMGNAFEKGKNINIEQFGRFKVLTRKNDRGEEYRYISFSPVKKFVKDVNYKYNDLEAFPIDDSEDELYEDSPETYKGVEVLNPDYFVFTEKTGKDPMSDNKKFDDNLLRDNFSDEEFSQSGNSNQERGHTDEKKDYELPSSIIQLHKDITNEEKSNISPEIHSKKDESMDLSEDIERIVEERKKRLDDITSGIKSLEHKVEHHEEESIEDMREKFEEVRNFNDEKNEELYKIISERNKIIDDINKMVNESEIDLGEHKTEEPLEEPKRKIEKNDQFESSGPEEKQEITEISPDLQTEEDFDPIVINEDEIKKHDTALDNQFEKIETPEMKNIDYKSNEILTPEDTEILKTGAEDHNKIKEEPKSFEDVFETSGEIKDDAVHRESNIPPTHKIEDKHVVKELQPQSQRTLDTYHDRMEKRRAMYENESSGGSWKAFGIIGVILAVLVLLIYWGYNSNMFSPAPPLVNNEQQSENIPPPAGNNQQHQQNNVQDNNQQQKITENKNSPPLPPSGEEYITETGMDVVLVRTAQGFFIQTASFKRKPDADREAKNINANGKEVSVKEADLGGKGIYFRVRVGTFETKEEAIEFAKEMN